MGSDILFLLNGLAVVALRSCFSNYNRQKIIQTHRIVLPFRHSYTHTLIYTGSYLRSLFLLHKHALTDAYDSIVQTQCPLFMLRCWYRNDIRLLYYIIYEVTTLFVIYPSCRNTIFVFVRMCMYRMICVSTAVYRRGIYILMPFFLMRALGVVTGSVCTPLTFMRKRRREACQRRTIIITH